MAYALALKVHRTALESVSMGAVDSVVMENQVFMDVFACFPLVFMAGLTVMVFFSFLTFKKESS
ncbi:hypothetical protein [Desulfobacter hydrogenophilus]|uniref:hypothetical protein n=1 Tax=Desulfobacter hydrogenophilus TaxID=2291 RepID=UPI001A942AA5|nr:hypothetical protein [Desulfobacter hydrogenophilus]